jgi:hypothetical protein
MGKSSTDPAITRKLMTNLFDTQRRRSVEPITDRNWKYCGWPPRVSPTKPSASTESVTDGGAPGAYFAKLQATSRTEAVMRVSQDGSHRTGQIAEE